MQTWKLRRAPHRRHPAVRLQRNALRFFALNTQIIKLLKQVKKWNAVALWAWDIVVDTCAICRNHIMDLCIECQANQVNITETLHFLTKNLNFRHRPPTRSAPWLGASATTLSTSIASRAGCALVRFKTLV